MLNQISLDMFCQYFWHFLNIFMDRIFNNIGNENWLNFCFAFNNRAAIHKFRFFFNLHFLFLLVLRLLIKIMWLSCNIQKSAREGMIIECPLNGQYHDRRDVILTSRMAAIQNIGIHHFNLVNPGNIVSFKKFRYFSGKNFYLTGRSRLRRDR